MAARAATRRRGPRRRARIARGSGRPLERVPAPGVQARGLASAAPRCARRGGDGGHRGCGSYGGAPAVALGAWDLAGSPEGPVSAGLGSNHLAAHASPSDAGGAARARSRVERDDDRAPRRLRRHLSPQPHGSRIVRHAAPRAPTESIRSCLDVGTSHGTHGARPHRQRQSEPCWSAKDYPRQFAKHGRAAPAPDGMRARSARSYRDGRQHSARNVK